MSHTTNNKKHPLSEMNDFDKLCVNTIRCLAADVVQKANSGHPGIRN